MKKLLITITCLTMAAALAWSQTQKKQPEKKVIVHHGNTYLAGGTISSGTISKTVFDSLMALPLVARDTAGVDHPVIEYTFSYAERGLYEDSVGRPKIMTDYYSVTATEGKLPPEWINMLKNRSKKGDTAYIDGVTSFYPDKLSTRFYTQPIKLVITE